MFKAKTQEDEIARAVARGERDEYLMFKLRAPEDETAKAGAREQEYRQFLTTPAGQARLAFDRGDRVFQCSQAVMSQEAIVVAMVGSTTSEKERDPSAELNAVCNEGWELVNGCFVFVEQGQQSRDKFLSSGQNVAVKGQTVGYYLFGRCEANRVWNQAQEASEP